MHSYCFDGAVYYHVGAVNCGDGVYYCTVGVVRSIMGIV